MGPVPAAEPEGVVGVLVAHPHEAVRGRAQRGAGVDDGGADSLLQVIPIELPPLRERKEDIPLIANHFISAFNKEFKKNVKPIGNDVKALFENYSWPGNVRELKNILERAILLEAEEELLPEHLPHEVVFGEESADMPEVRGGFAAFYPMSLKEMEKVLIGKTLEETNGNKSKAARILGISRLSL